MWAHITRSRKRLWCNFYIYMSIAFTVCVSSSPSSNSVNIKPNFFNVFLFLPPHTQPKSLTNITRIDPKLFIWRGELSADWQNVHCKDYRCIFYVSIISIYYYFISIIYISLNFVGDGLMYGSLKVTISDILYVSNMDSSPCQVYIGQKLKLSLYFLL